MRLVSVCIGGERFLERSSRILPGSKGLQRGGQVKPARGICGVEIDELSIGRHGLSKLLALVLQVARSSVDFGLLLATGGQRLFDTRQRLLRLALQMESRHAAKQLTGSDRSR